MCSRVSVRALTSPVSDLVDKDLIVSQLKHGTFRSHESCPEP